MALQDVITAVTARLPAGTPVKVGKKYLAGNDSPPRVVFVPTRDGFGPAERIGGGQRTLMTRRAGCQIHVWAADVAATELLVHQVLAAVHLGIAQDLDITQIAPGGYELKDGGWLDQAWANSGEVWVGNVEFRFPVLEQAKPTAVVTDFPQTNEMETVEYSGAIGGGIGSTTTIDEDAG